MNPNSIQKGFGLLTGRFALAGLAGGFAGFVACTVSDSEPAWYASAAELNSQTAVWFAVYLIPVAAALLAMDSKHTGTRAPRQQWVLALLAVGALGLVAGYIAQAIYNKLLQDVDLTACLFLGDCLTWQQVLARTIGWTIAGMLGGLGVGVGFGSKERAKNSALGGTIGGCLAGLVFDFIGAALRDGTDAPSQFIALCIVGALIGSGIGFVETLRPPAKAEIAPPPPYQSMGGPTPPPRVATQQLDGPARREPSVRPQFGRPTGPPPPPRP